MLRKSRHVRSCSLLLHNLIAMVNRKGCMQRRYAIAKGVESYSLIGWENGACSKTQGPARLPFAQPSELIPVIPEEPRHEALVA